MFRRKAAQFYRLLSLFFLLVIAGSCSDSGCIEADDFGEYETQILEVVASSNSQNCYYDSSKPITDASQGSGLKACFISGDVTIYDESGASQVSSSGCSGLPSAKFQNLCVMQCVSDCNAKISADSSGTAEPNWKSTSPKESGINGGVNLRPNSEVRIRAIGSIQLGNSFDYPAIFVKSDEFLPQSNDDEWNRSFFDFVASKALTLSFSGEFNDNSRPNGGTTPIGKVGAGKSSQIQSKLYNAAKRLVIYTIPHPPGYEFDKRQGSEQAGSINVPLLPDANMWQCDYSGENPLQSICTNKSYFNNGYPLVNDEIVKQTFPIASYKESTVLGKYGGIIRWDNDGLKADIEDPFTGLDCAANDCDSQQSEYGQIAGDYSSGVEIIVAKPSKIAFRYALNAEQCDNKIQISLISGSTILSEHEIELSNKHYNTEHISLEPGQKIAIKANPATFTGASGQPLSCGKALAVKTTPYHDIEIRQSGLISFATLGALSEGSCTINARIINPNGSKIDLNANYSADYYEYGDFSSNLDPLREFNVPLLTDGQIWDSGTIDKGSDKVFVRKGQIIRFSPESWNQNWDSKSGQRQCGIGMAMRIEPRPALLCRGYGNSQVANSNCVPKYTENGLVGCEERASECLDEKTPAYCPDSNCHKEITCVDGSATSTPPYTRTSCVLGEIKDAASCQYDPNGSYNSTTCQACSNAMLNNASASPYIDQANISKCYDLEDYQGKVANIPIAGFTSQDLASESIAKGARELHSFDGVYGNLSDFVYSGKKDPDTDNALFNFRKIINVTNSSRLKIILLDGDDFLNIDSFYNDNSSPGTKYSGFNGFKIGLSANLDFFNGAWLEAILCAESSDDSVDCRSSATPIQITDQPEVVRYKEPTPQEIDPQSLTSFAFDPYGTLKRIKSSQPNGQECVNAIVGDVYYCHTDNANPVDKIRLSFKIKDPEEENCNIQDPKNDSGFNGVIISNPKFRISDCDVNNPNQLNPIVKNGISTVDTSGNRTCIANDKAGETCKASEVENCTKEFICTNKYANNSGKYNVAIRVKNPGSTISNIVDDVISPVIEIMDGKKDGSTIGQAERIYTMIISDTRYRAILSMALVIMITFYGLTYLMGVNNSSLPDIFTKVIKIALIYLFIGPEGWKWFDAIVVKFFKNGTDYLSFLMASSFDDSPELQKAIDGYDFYDKSILFNSVDKVFSLIFSSTVQKKISGLLFASIFGWVYILIIYYAILAYIYAVSTAVLLYLTAQVFISVLFVLGPIFFIFTLFGQTKEMFDKWLQQLIGFSLQQIFLLVTLAFFNMMMYEVIKMSLGYKVCWEEVWTINIITRISLMSFWTIPSLPPSIDSVIEAGSIGKNDGIPSFFSILFMWVIAKLMHEFISFMTSVASEIGGGMSLSSLSSGVSKAVGEFRKNAGEFVGKRVWDRSGGQALRVIDYKLFDSGAEAKKQRNAKRQQNSIMQNQKAALESSGRKAVKEFKRKSGAELVGMSRQEQQQKLKQIRDKAMSKKGAEMGLSEGQIKKLKSDKGLKYVDYNLVGLAGKAGYQAMRKGGSLTKSLGDKKAKTGFTKQDAKKALKNSDEKGREQFIKSVKEGEIFVDAGRIRKRRMNLASGLKSQLNKRKERQEAIKQLENEGEISKMAIGTGWSRNDVEKKKIRDRLKKNIEAKENNFKKASRASTVASLEHERRYLEESASKEGGTHSRADNLASKLIGRRRYFTGKKGKKKARKDINNERLSGMKSRFEGDMASATEQKQQADEQVRLMNERISNNTDYSDALNALENHKTSIARGDFTTPERQKIAQERLQEYQNEVKYHENAMKETFAARNAAQADSSNAQARIENANKSIATIDSVQKIQNDPTTSKAAQKRINSIVSKSFGDSSIEKLDRFVRNHDILTKSPENTDES